MTSSDGPGVELSALIRVYRFPALVLAVGLAVLMYALVPSSDGDAGSEVTVTIFAEASDLRLDELPRSMSTVFDRPAVLERANRALDEQGLEPIRSLQRDQIDLDPVEGTPFARVVAVDADQERAEAVARAVAGGLVEELARLGPSVGDFEVLPDAEVTTHRPIGLAPAPRAIVAILASLLMTTGILIALHALFQPAVEGVGLPYPVVTVVNTSTKPERPRLAEIVGVGKVADLVESTDRPVYLASFAECGPLRFALATTLAERVGRRRVLDVPSADASEVGGVGAGADGAVLGELALSSTTDVSHRIIGQDARVILVAREGSRFRPLGAAAAQFPPESIVGLVLERRRYMPDAGPVSPSSDRSKQTGTASDGGAGSSRRMPPERPSKPEVRSSAQRSADTGAA